MTYIFLISIALLGVLCLIDNHDEIMKDEMEEK